MQILLLSLLILIFAWPVEAQPPPPGSPQVTQLSTDETGADYSVTWGLALGATSYRYTTGYEGNFNTPSGTVTVPPVLFKMPYTVSGAAIVGFFCVKSVNSQNQESVDQSCTSLPVPAKPIIPPPLPTGHRVTLKWNEPTLNADNTPLNDLRNSLVRYQLGFGPEVDGPNVPATSLQGGGIPSIEFVVPSVSGTATFRVYAEDTSNNRSGASNPAIFTLGPPEQPSIIVRPIRQ